MFRHNECWWCAQEFSGVEFRHPYQHCVSERRGGLRPSRGSPPFIPKRTIQSSRPEHASHATMWADSNPPNHGPRHDSDSVTHASADRISQPHFGNVDAHADPPEPEKGTVLTRERLHDKGWVRPENQPKVIQRDRSTEWTMMHAHPSLPHSIQKYASTCGGREQTFLWGFPKLGVPY